MSPTWHLAFFRATCSTASWTIAGFHRTMLQSSLYCGTNNNTVSFVMAPGDLKVSTCAHANINQQPSRLSLLGHFRLPLGFQGSCHLDGLLGWSTCWPLLIIAILQKAKIPLLHIYSTTVYSSRTTAKKSSWGDYNVAVFLKVEISKIVFCSNPVSQHITCKLNFEKEA